MRVAINALWRATAPSGICKHAAAMARCLCGRPEIERVFMLIGSWQERYFRQSFQLSDRKLVLRCVDIANRPYARNLWYLYGLPKAADELAVHIVQMAFPVPLNRGRLTMPVVTTLHDLYPYDAPWNFGFPRVLGHRALLRQCLIRSDRIACVSDFTLNRFVALFGGEMSDKVARIYNCVEVSDLAGCRPPLQVLERRPFLLCVAQHRRNKNIGLLLEGFAAMLAEGTVSKDTILLIVGSEGPETPEIMRDIAKLALKDCVLLAQGIDDGELAWLYKHTLLALCTSTLEGFGLPIAEAIQYGTRAVCSDIPVLREIGRDCCTFFSLSGASPVQNFVRACQQALRESPRRAVHTLLFSPGVIGTEYMNLYSGLLEARLAKAA